MDSRHNNVADLNIDDVEENMKKIEYEINFLDCNSDTKNLQGRLDELKIQISKIINGVRHNEKCCGCGQLRSTK